MIRRAKLEGKKVHVATLMHLCHLENSDLENRFQKNRRRVMLRGDILKDDSGDYAVFTEQGASASHMTEGNVLDITSRLPEHSGHASDALGAYSQVKMKDAPELLQFSEDCPKIWITLPKARRPQNWDSLDDPVAPLELNLYGHPLA